MGTDDFYTVRSPLKLEELERGYMQYMLDQCNGNLAKAGKLLGVPRATMYRKMKKHKLKREKRVA